MASINLLGREALPLHADVSDRDALRKAFESAVTHFGAIDVVVSNAAINHRWGVLSDMGSDEAWESALEVFQVTQFGAWHTAQLGAEHMATRARNAQDKHGPLVESQGKIILIGSIMSRFAAQRSSAYAMSKAAIERLGDNLALEMAKYRVNVNVVLPGYIGKAFPAHRPAPTASLCSTPMLTYSYISSACCLDPRYPGRAQIRH